MNREQAIECARITDSRLYVDDGAPPRAKAEAPTVPAGWKLVPIEPSVAMHNAAAFGGLCGSPPKLTDDGRIEWQCADPSAVYKAMIEAAPAAPERFTPRKQNDN